jgi:hypothetical protein
LTATPEKAYIKSMERVKTFHPEALEKGIKNPEKSGAFRFARTAFLCRPLR